MNRFLTMIAVAVLITFPMLADDIPQINGVQYWIDNNHDAAVSESSQEFDVDCSKLSTGLHMLHLRVLDSTDKYSQLYEYGFLKVAESVKADSIQSLQYWIDNNHDAAVSESSQEFNINCSNLPFGLHLLHIRAIDSNGRYSQLYEYGFLKVAENVKADSIQSLQYWWDDIKDNAVTAPYTSETFTLSTNALPYGLHSLKYRVKDSAGRWSEQHSHYFYKGEALDSARIVSYSYWWNDLVDDVKVNQIDSLASSFVIDEDLIVPQEARTGYAGHYTATLNLCVTDNRGKTAYMTSNIEYPDNDSPITDIDAVAYLASAKTGVKIIWEEKSNDKMGDFNVYVSKDNAPFYLWLPDTEETNGLYYGVAGSTYRFTVTGRDAYGNREKYDETKCVSVTFE